MMESIGDLARKAIFYENHFQKSNAAKYYEKASLMLEKIIQDNPKNILVQIYKDRIYSYRNRSMELQNQYRLR